MSCGNKPRQFQPCTSWSDGIFKRVEKVVLEDHRMTGDHIASKVGISTLFRIFRSSCSIVCTNPVEMPTLESICSTVILQSSKTTFSSNRHRKLEENEVKNALRLQDQSGMVQSSII
ncbi:hypothetical protein C0J52_09290 [Blattella germanica]|nr:hypothetical protein C0J52_09290 [Blattella germanica]